MRSRLRVATRSHVEFAARYLSQNGMAGEAAKQRLQANARQSRIWAAMDVAVDMPVAIWGVTPEDESSNVGLYWMIALGSLPCLAEHLNQLMPFVIEEMLDRYDRIEGFVGAEEQESLEFRARAGFTIEAAYPALGFSRLIHLAWIKRP